MLYNRYSFGGTSHKDVFEYLDEKIPQSEIANSIYISFSDNYSDIKKVYGDYRVIQKIRKFWVTTDKDVDVKGRKVLMR